MGRGTEREGDSERENWEIYSRSLIQTIFHKKKKKSKKSLSNPFQPFILVTFDRRSFQDFHFDFVPFLFHFVIRFEIDRIFSVHSLFSSSPPPCRFIIRPNGIGFSLPKSYWDDRVTSFHRPISLSLEPRFPTLSTNGGTIFESGIIVVEQRTFRALSRLSEVEGGVEEYRGIFFLPMLFVNIFCRANVYPSNILNYSKFCIEEEGKEGGL